MIGFCAFRVLYRERNELKNLLYYGRKHEIKKGDHVYNIQSYNCFVVGSCIPDSFACKENFYDVK